MTERTGQAKAVVLGATSRGLALASAMAARFGPIMVWEPDPDKGRPARGTRGVSAVTADLGATVRDAAIVACAIPRRDLASALEAAAGHLAHGAIVIVATLGHEAAHATAQRVLPAHVSVACFTTFPPPGTVRSGRDLRSPLPVATAAAAGISPAVGAHPDAIGVVQAIVEATGTVPFFAEAREIDGFAAATIALPAVLGAAAIRATISPRTSRDLDRAGGGPLATLTEVVDGESADVPNSDDLKALREPIARLLRVMASDLQHVASQLDGEAGGAGEADERAEGASVDPAGIGPAAERRRTWLAARATPADAPIIEDLPMPKRRRLFF